MGRKKISAPKVIADPIYGIFDVRPVLPMIETAEFQALGDKRQLGMSYLTFPSATHTRRAHSLGAYHATRVLADRWVEWGLINEAEADALAGYALYHDIGHPAFSHVTEDLCLKDNDELGLDIIHGLKSQIEAAGINYSLLEKMAHHENPLYLAVHDKNLGMEKLDYLERDGYYTILARPAGVDYLRKHIYFVNGALAIDEKVIDNAIEAQNFYVKMYKNVYLRKASAIAQRMFQKVVYHLISAGEISAEDLPKLTDSELIGAIRFSKNPVVQELYELLKKRELFREAIVIRPEHFAHAEPKTGKPVAHFGVSPKEMARLIESPQLRQKNQDGLEKLESEIAEIAGIPQHSVLLVPIFNPHRFEAKDIKIYVEGGESKSMKDRYPAHFQNMKEVAQSYLALRVCTLEKYRKILSSPKIAKEVVDILVRHT
ncbi:MAG: HD domain-containing protein [Candidatus Liptonbacteria bacterium]|nr:HD domain-containing protein [Candidatus Liptonbacteria bacterium]